MTKPSVPPFFYLLLCVCIPPAISSTSINTEELDEMPFWTFNTMVNSKLYSTIKLSTNQSKISKHFLSKNASIVYSLTLYLKVIPSSLDYVDLSEWNDQYPQLEHLSIFRFGTFNIVFLRMFKCQVSSIDISNRFNLKFPARFQFHKLKTLILKSRSIVKLNISHICPNLETLTISVDKFFNGVSNLSTVKSLTIIYGMMNELTSYTVKDLPRLTVLNVVNKPNEKQQNSYLANLPSLSEVSFSDGIVSSEFQCRNLSHKVTIIKLVHVDPSITKTCPELYFCPHCGHYSTQQLFIDAPYPFNMDSLQFPGILPDLPSFNITHLLLINLIVKLSNSSLAKFSLLRHVVIRITSRDLIERMKIEDEDVVLGDINLQFLKNVIVSFPGYCCGIIGIVKFFKVRNRLPMLEVDCVYNDTLYTKYDVMSLEQFCTKSANSISNLYICLLLLLLTLELR